MSGNNLRTFIGRVTDGLILVASVDNSFSGNDGRSAKSILRTLKDSSLQRCTIQDKNCFYHYIIADNVAYVTVCERGYDERLAFKYLYAIEKEFNKAHGHQVNQFSRPYAAVSFDRTLNKIRREFIDPESPANIQKLGSDLNEIRNVMRQNIDEVLGRGEKLSVVQDQATSLRSDTSKFRKKAKKLNMQALWKKWAPCIAVMLVVILVLYLRFFR